MHVATVAGEIQSDLATALVVPRRGCVAFDNNERCNQWVTEYGDITRIQRIRLDAKRAT